MHLKQLKHELAANQYPMPQNWRVVYPFNVVFNYPFNIPILGGMKPFDIPTISDSVYTPVTARGAGRRGAGRRGAGRKGASSSRQVANANIPVTSGAASDTSLPASEDDGVLSGYVNAISRRDQIALAHLYDLTISRVYSVALRIVRHAHLAEEVVSDVYMQVWRDAERYDATRGRVLGWLLIITRSRALDLLRRQDEAFSHPEPYDLITEPESEQKSAHDLMTDSEAGIKLRAAIETLTPLQRQLLSLAFFRGLSHAEIVAQSGIPLGSVKTHIRRALALLRSQLGRDMRLND